MGGPDWPVYASYTFKNKLRKKTYMQEKFSQNPSINKFTHHLTGNSYNIMPIAVIYLITDIPFVAILIQIIVNDESIRGWLHFFNIVVLHFFPFLAVMSLLYLNKKYPHIGMNDRLLVRGIFGYQELKKENISRVTENIEMCAQVKIKRLSVFDKPNIFIEQSKGRKCIGIYVDKKNEFIQWYKKWR